MQYNCKVLVNTTAAGTELDPKLIVIECSKPIGMEATLSGNQVVFNHSSIAANRNGQATFTQYQDNQCSIFLQTVDGQASVQANDSVGQECIAYEANVTINLLP